MTAADLPTIAELHRAAEAAWDAGGWHEREWLLVDGRGGYACGTALELPTRRYHGWLTAVPDGQSRRVRLLAGVDERVDDGRGEQAWSVAHWQGLDAPEVGRVLRSYRHEPAPTWHLRCGDTGFERALVMPRGERAVLARWRNTGRLPLRLAVRPLLDCVDADALSRERTVDTAVLRAPVAGTVPAVGFRPEPGLPPLWLCWEGPAGFEPQPDWYRGYFLSVEAARGYDAVCDRFAPGVLVLDLAPGAEVTAAFAVGEPLAAPGRRFEAELARRRQRVQWAQAGRSTLEARLRRGVDDFCYRAEGGRPGVLAGFPWFGEWGRDVFVALPGLSLAVGEPERCEAVLAGAQPFLRRGLLPNVYGRTPEDSRYNSADAALWFALCVQRWQDAGAGGEAVRAQFGASLRAIAEAYLEGTELGLGVDEQGLLLAGGERLNATWMDAETAAGPVTPRDGQPVELCALWCSLLLHLGELYGGEWRARAAAAGRAFVARFWRRDAGCLYDRVDRAGRGDTALRPNMVIAAALPRSPLSSGQRQAIVEAAQPLVTPRGLRTLAPDDPGYRGRYRGGPEERDAAYHQGTVWPWLGGFYTEAVLRAAGSRAAKGQLAAARTQQLAWLQGFLVELSRCGFDHVNEVFDGDPPHAPGGTFAQAWNTGELLRALRLCAPTERPA